MKIEINNWPARVGVALLVLFALVGFYLVARQAVEDYSNFRKIVAWVSIQQQQQEQARQRAVQQQQQQRAAPPTSLPVAPSAPPEK